MSIEQIWELALALPPEERVGLAEVLWESVLPEYPVEADESDFVAELLRRDKEMTDNPASCRSYEEVMAHARRIAGC
jgi:putative addiction module component (TIGR02574 family)